PIVVDCAANGGYTQTLNVSAGNFIISKATPTLSIGNSPVTYNGSAQAAAVNGSVGGSVSSVQYNGSGTVPTNAATYAITANFTPTDTNNYNSLTAVPAGNFVISKAATTATVGATTPIVVGQNATFTATVSPSAATGTIQFKVDGVNVGSPVTVSGGSATSAPVSGLTVGNRIVTAVYSGDTNYTTSTSAGVTQVVNNLTATTTTVGATTTITYGSSATFTATVSPSAATGTIQFKVDGANVGSPVTVSGGSATSAAVPGLAAGTRSVTAVYSGVSTYATSTSAVVNQQVNARAVTLSGSRAYDGTTAAAAAILSITNKVGADDVTVASGSATLASAGVGTRSISSMGTLALGGTTAGNYTLTGATGSVSISQAATTTTVGATTTITYGSIATFTATVSPSAATGTIQFKVDGVNVGSPVTVSGGSATSAAVTGLTAGTRSVTAVYGGDTNYTTSTSAVVNQTVNARAVTLSGSRTYDGTTAAAAAILSITNKVGADDVTVASGSATLASAGVGSPSISSMGTLALGGTTAGNYTLTGATGSVTINQAATTTTVGATTPIVVGQNATFTATVSPSTATGTIQFKVDGVNVGSPVTVSAGSATSAPVSGLTVGNRIVTAVYSGDTNYTTSTSAGVTQVVSNLTATTTTVGATTTITYGSSATFTATVSPSAATGTIQFKVDGANVGSPVTVSGGSATSA